MTEQEQKAFDQMREALEHIQRCIGFDKATIHQGSATWCEIEDALTAANAVSHPQATEPVRFGSYEHDHPEDRWAASQMPATQPGQCAYCGNFDPPPQTQVSKYGRQEFKKYIEDCELHCITPDIAGAFNAGFLTAGNAVQPQAQGEALTEDEFCALQFCEQMLAQIEAGKARRRDEAHFQDFRAATIKDARQMAAAALKRVAPVFRRLMDAAIATHPQATEPTGWKLVPVEPTPEMCNAARWSEYGEETSRQYEVSNEFIQSVWASLLAAAPEAHHE